MICGCVLSWAAHVKSRSYQRAAQNWILPQERRVRDLAIEALLWSAIGDPFFVGERGHSES